MASVASSSQDFEDIINRMSNLLDNNNELEFEDGDPQEDILPEWKRCLVFKLVTGRGYAFSILKEMLGKAWRTSGELSISDLGKNIYKVGFENLSDMEAILKESPWALNNELMVLERCDEDLLPEEYEFKHVWFWIQIHGLPISMLNRKKILSMSKKFGSPQDISDEDAAKWGKYARARVKIDITKPLPKEMKVTLASKKIRMAQFTYEKLPRLCYYCGLFSHAMKQCPVLSKNLESLKLDTEDFSEKMVDPRLARYSDEIRVDYKNRDKATITPIIIPAKMCSPAIQNLQTITVNGPLAGVGDSQTGGGNTVHGRQQSDEQNVSTMLQQTPAGTKITSSRNYSNQRVEIAS